MTPTLIATANDHFANMALAELKAVDGQVVAQLAPGIWAVHLPQDFFTLAERWRAAPPVFVRHICPVQTIIPLADGIEKVLETAVTTFTHLLEPDWPFSVQTRVLDKLPFKPYDINKPLSDQLAAASGVPLDVRAPFQILSVVLAGDEAYLGLSLAVNNLSDWAGGVRRFAREPEQISRAEFKLLEALESFKIELPSRGRALDLGAAPGGWTRVLRQKEQYVTAVDPAWLHPTLQTDKGVRHLRLTAEDYLERYPDSYDVIVNDMRLDARDSARLMVAYGRYLYPHGLAIITLKLPEKKYHAALDHALNILRRSYTIAGARQLFHNRSEVTVYLKPKDG
ncbi:23S rRNA (cytidine(2498)-2'-O)-methyltransferase [hydrothermal vent metagenome]|uniref:23S rRNA (Cytidine(2498)-2'-O)-methyltransferase n=1 Tax=hydrothermal vent metagenome TaxID=652676 RepID=A0A3B0UZ22_9ZZZZ